MDQARGRKEASEKLEKHGDVLDKGIERRETSGQCL